MTTLIDTYKDLWEKVVEIARNDPAHVYPKVPDEGCLYVHGGPPLPEGSDEGDEDEGTDEDAKPLEPGCLVGHALAALGVSLEDLKCFEGQSAGEVAEFFVRERTEEDQYYIELLNAAQGNQDMEMPWEPAVDEALEAQTVERPEKE